MTQDVHCFPRYLVVPLQGQPGERTVRCQYFLDDEGRWISVTSSDLCTLARDFIVIQQPEYEEAARHVPDADPTLRLFAVVAKTRNAHHRMPNLMAAEHREVVVAVYPKTIRSAILVFERHDPATGDFGELVATTDPDVPHGGEGAPGQGTGGGTGGTAGH